MPSASGPGSSGFPGAAAATGTTPSWPHRGHLTRFPAESALTSLADQFRIRTAIPDAQIEVFEGRGHNIYLEEPRRCTRRIRRFLQGLGDGGGPPS